MKGLTRSGSLVKEETVSKLQNTGFFLLRYGLVLVIAWIGGMKATEYEARNIERLIAHSPLLS
jgi:reactive chlorine resistance protein C